MTRLLVIRLSSIGDIVHTLPAVAALGEAFPETEIHWAVEPRYACLLEGNPFVRRIVKVDTLGWGRHLASAITLEEIARAVLQLRSNGYDMAVDFQGLVKSAAIAWLSGARERWGLSEYWLKEPISGVFYTERVSAQAADHVVKESMVIVERIIATSNSRSGNAERLLDPESWKFPLPHSVEAEQYVEQQLRALAVEDFMIINPGGGWMAKRWAPANYADLIRRMSPKLSLKVLLTGSPEEEPIIKSIVEQAGSADACYFPSTLVRFVALARRARLFVGGDTGPLHIAAALGTPIVAIHGPTDPARNGPFSKSDIALSNLGPIDHTRRNRKASHIEGISVDSVLNGIYRRLAVAADQQHG